MVPSVVAVVSFLFLSLATLPVPVSGEQVYRYEFNPLVIDSGLIIVADITGIVGSYSSPTVGVSGLVFQVAVSEWVKGSGYPYPLTVVDGNSTVEGSMGDPSIQVGNRYVLFLFNTGVSEGGFSPGGLCLTYPPVVRCHYFPPPTNETWGITGGPQGKFLVKDGLVYGFKTLYPQLYGNMIVNADGVPLDQFVSLIHSTQQFVSLPTTWGWLAIPFLLLALLGRSRRVREWRHARLLQIPWLIIGYAAAVAWAVYFTETASFTFLTTLNFWIGFSVFGALSFVGFGIVLPRKEHYKRLVGETAFVLGWVLAAVSPVIVILVVLFQAGNTMFEKDFYGLALVHGVLTGPVIGAILGDTLQRLKVFHTEPLATTPSFGVSK